MRGGVGHRHGALWHGRPPPSHTNRVMRLMPSRTYPSPVQEPPRSFGSG
jgi:hypothetical protein